MKPQRNENTSNQNFKPFLSVIQDRNVYTSEKHKLTLTNINLIRKKSKKKYVMEIRT